MCIGRESNSKNIILAGMNIYQAYTITVCFPDKEHKIDKDKRNVWTVFNDKERVDTWVMWKWIFLLAVEEDICHSFFILILPY